MTLGIASAAVILFVGNGGSVLPQIVRGLVGDGTGPDRLLTNALLLNIALVIFGWRRYRDLSAEIVDRRRAEALALELAEHDALTGCLNRRSIGAAASALATAAHARGDLAAFIMLDLDRFKQVNDVNGHAAGDCMLGEAASRIRESLPPQALLARLGGDEFAVILPFVAARSEEVERLAEKLIAKVALPVHFGEFELETTISAGISKTEPGQSPDIQAQLHMADIAMYHAKRNGRNRYAWFEPNMENEQRFRSEIAAGIRRGIPLGEFVPYYEKQIDLENGTIAGFEMLARWNSPKLGMVNPEIFIPVAEEIGVIAELSECLIKQALRDARNWDPKLTLSVNISPVQLRDPWFAQKLLKILLEANFPPSRLEIEVTESCLHENVGLVRSLITSLKNQGITVSLDDFGTGYSSLSQLRILPFDRIKIDRSFVMSLLEDKDSATIIQSIISLGEGLGLPITAEGIESEAVLTELRRFGKFKGQGYLYGFPEPADRTEATLAQLDLLLEPPAAPVAVGKQRAAR
ncbi:MAG: EAL domain-containing protein [Pseudomonadota bacterium]|nr:EAL domain-containing protein [Pseudomonadota bacterium]